MPKDSSAKYYQKNCYKKNLVKDIKIFLKKKKRKRNNMVVSNTKICQKIINKSLLSIEKYITKCNYHKTLLFLKVIA